MDLLLLLLLLLGAFFAGLLGAMLGVGGGIIIVPLLTILFNVPASEARGASLIAVIVTSSAGATYYVEQKIVNIRLGMLLEVLTVAGAILGAFLEFILSANKAGQDLLQVLFGAVLVYVAYYVTIGRPQKRKQSDPHTARKGLFGNIPGSYRDEATGQESKYEATNVPRGLFAAGLAGILSGLFGIGGGIVKVPAMLLWMDVPTKVATATSNFMIGVTGTAGAAIYYTTGTIIPSIVAPTTIGVFAGAMLGSRVASKVQSVWLRRIFALFLIATAIQMIAKALGVGPF